MGKLILTKAEKVGSYVRCYPQEFKRRQSNNISNLFWFGTVEKSLFDKSVLFINQKCLTLSLVNFVDKVYIMRLVICCQFKMVDKIYTFQSGKHFHQEEVTTP